MEARGLRYFIGFVVVIGLLILLIVLIFGGGDNKKVPTTSRSLSSYAKTDSEVSMTVDGEVNYAGDHRQIVVSVDRNHVLYQVKRGYNGDIVVSHDYPNTGAAYSTFLLSLEHANFTKIDTKHLYADPRGYCPLGQRYIFELNSLGSVILHGWTTSCGKPKTFLGDINTVTELFRNQVPDYNEISNDVQL